MEICREFGWTMEEYNKTPARDIDEIAVMLEEESILRKREHEIEMGKTRIRR